MSKWKQTTKPFLLIAGFCFSVCLSVAFWPSFAGALSYTSPSYGVDEVIMGSGGVNNATSPSYQLRASLGDLAVGLTGSENSQAYAGFVTASDPYIELLVNGVNTNVGSLSPTSAATTTATFSVRAYLANGYVVTNGSDPPTATSGTGMHVLDALLTPTTSSPGTEQFGINLVANTDPVTFGADPVELPDASYSFGVATSDYNQSNHYKYVKGDIIASSPKSSGTTQYTVSYLYNISQITPAGTYIFNHVIIATATY